MMAACLREWIPEVLQAADVWFSDKDIEAGQFWDEEIREHVKRATFAVVCVTPENHGAPWLNYEAGALAERLEGGVCPYILREPSNLLANTPLARLQAKTSDKSGTLAVLQAINIRLGAPLSGERLQRAFELHWGDLERALGNIPESVSRPRAAEEKLDEVLVLVQAMASRTMAVTHDAERISRAAVVKERMVQALLAAGVGVSSFDCEAAPTHPSGYGIMVTAANGAHLNMGVGEVSEQKNFETLALNAIETLRLRDQPR
jgi:hypothetical protein